MEAVLADYSASISELKRNPTALLREAEGEPIAILNHNRPAAYLVPAEVYADMLELIEDLQLRLLIQERLEEIKTEGAISVDINDL